MEDAVMPARRIPIKGRQDVVKSAGRASGLGVTETVFHRRFARLRGGVKFSVDLRRLREDRG